MPASVARSPTTLRSPETVGSAELCTKTLYKYVIGVQATVADSSEGLWLSEPSSSCK